MNRRKFIKSGALMGAVPTLTSLSLSTEIIKPKALEPGACIGIIAPSGALKRSGYEKLVESLKMLDYKIIHTDNLRVQNGFLAGTDTQKIEDLHHMYQNPKVSAILCARGGYGATRILEQLDYSLISKYCKPLIGYSDITALHLAIYKKCKIVGFHGPVGISTFNPFSIKHFNAVVQKGKRNKIAVDNPLVITSGMATGKLIGGNLSLLISMIGTPHECDWSNHIVFIEEVGESTYRIDRMLTQLRAAQKFKGIKGIILGQFTRCDAQPGDPYYEFSTSLKEVFKDRLGDLNIPVMGDFPFGHEEDNATLPIGIRATMDTKKGTLKLLESAVS
tara:strand:+ start:1279 stop:2277 length:999 start_codon:yes stop_codon:yes gene_type:complete